MSVMNFQVEQKHKEAGMVAIMVTLILMIVISLIVLGFAQVSRRTQRQALDRQLSTQAFYAAETGVNDAVKVIQDAIASGSTVEDKPDCNSDGNGFYAEPKLKPDIDEDNGVSYSCLTVDPEPTTLDYKNIGENSSVIPLSAASSINNVTLTWRTLDSVTDNPTPAATCRPNLTNPFLTTSAWSATNCGYGVLRIDLVPTAGSSLSTNGLQNATMTAFVVPLSSNVNCGTTPGCVSSVNYTTGGGNSRLGVVCTDSACSLRIANLSQTQYHLRVSSIYKDVSLQIVARDAGNAALNLRGAQALIDVTGKAQDVLRRIQVRVPLTASSTNILSDYAIQSTDPICKRFSVMQNYFRNDADNAVPGVENATTNSLCRP